jgi:hypothetical protein
MTANVVNYAILGQRKLKLNDLVATQAHNMREVTVHNAEPDGLPPIVVMGDPATNVAVRSRLRDLGIKPRKSAVVALELLVDVSKAWWPSEEPAVQALQRVSIERQVRKYLADRYPDPRCIVSMIWHVDETTEHLHVITIPARLRVDGRRRDGVAIWSLSARGDLLPKMAPDDRAIAYETACRAGVGGRGQMAHEQTIFASYMVPLKLQRGKVWSGTPNKPNRVYQAELAAATAARDVEREGHERARGDYKHRVAETAEFRIILARAKAEQEDQQADHDRRELALAEREAQTATAEAAIQERAHKAAVWERNARRRERDLKAREAAASAQEERTAGVMQRLSDVLSDADVVACAIAVLGEKGARFRDVDDAIRRLGAMVGDAGMRDAAFARNLRQARATGAAGLV